MIAIICLAKSRSHQRFQAIHRLHNRKHLKRKYGSSTGRANGSGGFWKPARTESSKMNVKPSPDFTFSIWTNRVLPIRTGILLMMFVMNACASGVDPSWEEKRKNAPLVYEQRATTHIAWRRAGVSAALNRFVLTRKNEAACAFRFTSFRREGEFVPQSFFTMGGYKTFAEYEWHFQGDGSFDFTKSNVQSGKGQLKWGPDNRLGHGVRLPGNSSDNRGLTCGAFLITWYYPTHTTFDSYVNNELAWDPKRELAATRWENIKDVDFKNPKLRWFSGEKPPTVNSDEVIWLSLEELP